MDEAWLYVPANTIGYMGHGRRFVQVKRPNQQYQSTDGTHTVHQ